MLLKRRNYSLILDDFAQIVGTKISAIEANVESSRLFKLNKKCNALLIRNVGAFSWATPVLLAQEDAIAKPISLLDTHHLKKSENEVPL